MLCWPQVYTKVIKLYIIHIYIYTHTYAHIYVLFQILFHYTLLQDVEYSSLCYTVSPCSLSVLYIAVHFLNLYLLVGG